MKKPWRKLQMILVAVFTLSNIHAGTSSEVFSKYKNKYFVETGSYVGEGIQKAMLAGFDEIYSIEIYEKFYDHCRSQFAAHNNVHLVLGDSSLILEEVIKNIDEPITFWLDGHAMPDESGKGASNAPILKELEAIKNHPIKTHTILIDDVRLFGDFWTDYVSLKTIKRKLKEINPKYTLTFEDGFTHNDVLVAYIRK